MSAGPIAQERAGRVVPAVSTASGTRVCMRFGRRGYCGRTSAKELVDVWSKVTCADCKAAAVADGRSVA